MTGRARWQVGIDVSVLLGALVLALTPLQPVYGGTAAVPAVVAGLALGALLVLVGRWLRWAWWLVAGLGLVAGVLVGAVLVDAPRLGGVLPTPAALREVVVGAVTTWTDVITLTPPLGHGDVLLAPYLLALVGAALAVGAAGARRRALTGFAAVLPVAVLAVAVLLGTATPLLPTAVLGAVLGTVLLVWAAFRTGTASRHRLVAAATVSAVGLVGSWALAPAAIGGTARYVLRDHVVPPFDPSAYPSPLAAFRSYVKSGDEVLFTVSGTLRTMPRIRLVVSDRYDGTVWNVAGGHAAEGSGEFRRVGDTVATSTRGSTGRVTITVQGLSGVWLPTVGSATAFDTDPATAAQLRYNDATGGAVLTGGVHRGLQYTETAVVPTQPTDEQVGSAAAADVALPTDTDVPSVLADKAAAIARDAGTPVQQARALATWLTDEGYFSHGLADDYPSLAGHGAARMTQLLSAAPMVGDGEQYASALALMARVLKLPARVVLGFVPGSGDATTVADAKAPGSGTIAVRGKDVQAWVEIAFAGYGWVAFDATPPTTRTPTDQQQQTRSNPQPQVLQPPLPPQQPVTAPDDNAEQPHADGPRTDAGRPLWVTVATWGGIGLAAVLVLTSPLLVLVALKARRRRRRRWAPTPSGAVAGGWEELVDVARDLSRPPPPVATRRESARALTGAFATRPGEGPGEPVAGSLDLLAQRADHAVFSPHDPSAQDVAAYWADVESAVHGLRHQVGWRTRWRARVSTRSLRRPRGTSRNQRRRRVL